MISRQLSLYLALSVLISYRPIVTDLMTGMQAFGLHTLFYYRIYILSFLPFGMCIKWNEIRKKWNKKNNSFVLICYGLKECAHAYAHATCKHIELHMQLNVIAIPPVSKQASTATTTTKKNAVWQSVNLWISMACSTRIHHQLYLSSELRKRDTYFSRTHTQHTPQKQTIKNDR